MCCLSENSLELAGPSSPCVLMFTREHVDSHSCTFHLCLCPRRLWGSRIQAAIVIWKSFPKEHWGGGRPDGLRRKPSLPQGAIPPLTATQQMRLSDRSPRWPTSCLSPRLSGAALHPSPQTACESLQDLLQRSGGGSGC